MALVRLVHYQFIINSCMVEKGLTVVSQLAVSTNKIIIVFAELGI